MQGDLNDLGIQSKELSSKAKLCVGMRALTLSLLREKDGQRPRKADAKQ
jgi:hypothetical protein